MWGDGLVVSSERVGLLGVSKNRLSVLSALDELTAEVGRAGNTSKWMLPMSLPVPEPGVMPPSCAEPSAVKTLELSAVDTLDVSLAARRIFGSKGSCGSLALLRTFL